MKKIILLIYFSTVSIYIFCQGKVDFQSPMEIPLYLSGNFGEFRADHLHSGIDIKTQGVSGQHVYAVEAGYVSRIKIETGGYGKALYLAHPDGYTTVYGHLSNYNSKLSKYVKSRQYALKSQTLDLYFKAGEIPIEKGELIAYSGNTGSTAGPHLHFEVRKSSNQHPLNALLFKLPVEDNISPVFKKIVIYPLGSNSQVKNSGNPYMTIAKEENGVYRPEIKEPLGVFGTIGFGVEIYDYLNGSGNRCGIYSIEMLVDGARHYLSEMDEFSFGTSRFVNAHIDYALKMEQNINVQYLYKLPYDELGIYKFLENDGAVDFNDTLVHEIQIIAKDCYDNTSTLIFKVKGASAPQKMAMKIEFHGTVLPYNAPSDFNNRNIRLNFPAYCFYDNVKFSFARISGREDLLSDIFHVHNDKTPVQKNFKIALTPNEKPQKDTDKLCIVKLEDNDVLSYMGGSYEKEAVSAEVRSFGKFAIAIDTIPPSIEAFNFSKGMDLSNQKSISFLIKDNLSGIKTYAGFIDNQWILFEYDPKDDLLFYEFDDKVPIIKKNHELEIQLNDDKGNKNIYRTVFYR